MRSVNEIILCASTEWNETGKSEPILRGAKQLITEERFSDLDEYLANARSIFSLPPTAISYIKSKIAPIILNEYLYRCPEINSRVLELHWGDDDMAKAVSEAAFRPGALQAVVARLKYRLIELSEDKI
ncbi:hypothetical protein [Stutzerimonas frequens]|uniref:hypothetical protein n=1 Tax=Stutzerimonas frequens TaxID=2968969 RepID=UPI0013A61E39|nr:hypothetical protein [Stutzerimonas frequens]